MIVDPVWTLLEINRVMKTDGHLVVATPNAIGAFRLLNILAGRTPSTCNHIKPSSIYQRHNREWTPFEVELLLEGCGFHAALFTTNTELLREDERSLLELGRSRGFTTLPDSHFGPELFVVAKKVSHVTLDDELQKDRRWPEWLYTHFDGYRRRPKVYPIIWADDYA